MEPKQESVKSQARKTTSTRRRAAAAKAGSEWVKHPSGEQPKGKQALAADLKRSAHAKLSAGKDHCIYDILGVDKKKHPSLSLLVHDGIATSVISRLAQVFAVKERRMSEDYLGVASSTLRRRVNEKKLNVNESDAVVRYAMLFASARELMEGDEDAARRWLNSPLRILGNNTPIDHAKTEVGAREVEKLIRRLEHGVFS